MRNEGVIYVAGHPTDLGIDVYKTPWVNPPPKWPLLCRSVGALNCTHSLPNLSLNPNQPTNRGFMLSSSMPLHIVHRRRYVTLQTSARSAAPRWSFARQPHRRQPLRPKEQPLCWAEWLWVVTQASKLALLSGRAYTQPLLGCTAQI